MMFYHLRYISCFKNFRAYLREKFARLFDDNDNKKFLELLYFLKVKIISEIFA